MTEATSQGSPGGVRMVKSASRTVDILEFLAARQNEPAKLKDIADGLDTPRSSVYAVLRTLVAHGWVRTDRSGSFYSIGIRALLAGTAYLDADLHLRLIRPQIERLSEQLDETIHYGRLDGSDIVYLLTKDSSQYLRMHSRVGRRLPAHATALGKALLAERNEQPHGDLVALTPHTITDPQELSAELEATRQRGYAVEMEENSLGIRCVAFALHHSDPPTDAISCSVPTARYTDALGARIVDALRHLASDVARQMPPSPFAGGSGL